MALGIWGGLGIWGSAVVTVPPQGAVTLTGVTENKSVAALSFTYSEEDQEGFEYRINGGVSAILAEPNSIYGIISGVVYSVELRAFNSVGYSDWSSAVEFTGDTRSMANIVVSIDGKITIRSKNVSKRIAILS